MNQKRLLFLFAGLLPLTSKAQLPTARIDSAMKVAYDYGIFNGNILIAKSNTVLYQKSFGFADNRKDRALTPDTKFDIGSISKEFNGAGIMILKEKGLLTLETSVAELFPEFAAWAKKVKIKHLINYTSGIPKLSWNSPAGNDSLLYVDLKKLQALDFEPGTRYDYNYINVYLQHRIIERLSKSSYAAFIKDNIFIPAGMKQAIVDHPTTSADMARAFDNDGIATSYPDNFKGWVRLTALDLYLWEIALWNRKIIAEQSLKELAVAFGSGESSLGRVVTTDGRFERHSHQGSNFNYEAVVSNSFSDSITIVLMTNSQQMKVQALNAMLLHILRNEPFTVPKKSLYLSIRTKLLENTEDGLKYYQELKANQSDRYDFSSEIPDLLNAGKYLQRRKKLQEAIRVYQVALQLDGRKEDLSYAHELMGDAFDELGDKANALIHYQKATELDPKNKNAESKYKSLQGN